MPPRFLTRLSVYVLAVAAVVRAFDARIWEIRKISVVQADQLIHYNMFLTWWRFGDSPRGFTLTPSPYFVDLLLHLPLALLAPDYEWFSYALALAFGLAIFVSLVLVMRLVLDAGLMLAAAAAAVTVAAYYLYAPFSFVVHTFTSNHTGEVFVTLGMLALLHVLFRADRPRKRYAPAIYTVVLAACIVSSPFFIAMFCVPAAVGAAALLGTSCVTWRRLAWFLGLTAVGSLLGLVALAVISRYAWPVRADPYADGSGWKSWQVFQVTVAAEASRAAWATVVAMLLSIGLLIGARRSGRGSAPAMFMLGYFPACVVSCVVLPIKRGVFDGAYAFRYVQLPWILTVAVFVGIAAWLARRLACRLVQRLSERSARRLTWTTPLLGIAGIALVATAHGRISMFGPDNLSAPMHRCFAELNKTGTIHDGFATVWLARSLFAARFASGWGSPGVVMLVDRLAPPSLDEQNNNPLWFDGGYRRGQTKPNFLATHWLDDATLQWWRDRIGPPDRTVSCPVPDSLRVDGKPTFELWIWDRDEAQQRLADLATHDNRRGPFVPVLGARSMVVDPLWGMTADPRDSEVVAGHRVWKRGVHRDGVSMAVVRPITLPSGRYRIEVALHAVPLAGAAGPVAELVVHVPRSARIVTRRFTISADESPRDLEFNVDNFGGATSGAPLWMDLYPRAAASIDLAGITITLVRARQLSPFHIFQ